MQTKIIKFVKPHNMTIYTSLPLVLTTQLEWCSRYSVLSHINLPQFSNITTEKREQNQTKQNNTS